jgi:hypothetical protein
MRLRLPMIGHGLGPGGSLYARWPLLDVYLYMCISPPIRGFSCILSPVHVTIYCGLWPPGRVLLPGARAPPISHFAEGFFRGLCSPAHCFVLIFLLSGTSSGTSLFLFGLARRRAGLFQFPRLVQRPGTMYRPIRVYKLV